MTNENFEIKSFCWKNNRKTKFGFSSGSKSKR
jgi:hypothetical protein